MRDDIENILMQAYNLSNSDKEMLCVDLLNLFNGRIKKKIKYLENLVTKAENLNEQGMANNLRFTLRHLKSMI